jgi:nitroreductase
MDRGGCDMQVSHAIRERRSVRAFLDEPIPAETVLQIFDLAKWSPSWANTQDWNVYVVHGTALERIKGAFAILGGEGMQGVTDVPMPSREWPEYLTARMNVSTSPSETTSASLGVLTAGPSIWDFYGAPCLLLFAVDARLEPTYAAFDAGLLVQTFCLAAEDRGFSTCIMATAVRYADVLHEVIAQAAGQRFVVGVALGRADHTAVVNRGERDRVATSELVTFVNGEE